jgi:hypothetical protein
MTGTAPISDRSKKEAQSISKLQGSFDKVPSMWTA